MPETPAPAPSHGKVLHEWKFPEYPRYERSKRWYTVAGLIAAGAFVWAIWQNNVLFGIILILAAIIYVSVSQRNPRLIPFAITEDGVMIERDFYPWAEVDRFWIVYQPPQVKKLFFGFKGVLRPLLTVLLEKENPVAVRKTLLEYVKEDLNADEPASDQLSRMFKI